MSGKLFSHTIPPTPHMTPHSPTRSQSSTLYLRFWHIHVLFYFLILYLLSLSVFIFIYFHINKSFRIIFIIRNSIGQQKSENLKIQFLCFGISSKTTKLKNKN